ncbi:MAG: hypothetical protein M1835_007624 [Candelina submexicana]|nr:MAG: hypothetical protein M1835_007624 [Candelina submexicana]
MECESASNGDNGKGKKRKGDAQESEPAKAKRVRKKIACNECNRRKEACDAHQPGCHNCVRNQTICVYPARGAFEDSVAYQGMAAKISSLEQRINDLETMVQNLLQGRGERPVTEAYSSPKTLLQGRGEPPVNEAYSIPYDPPVLSGSKLDYWDFSSEVQVETTENNNSSFGALAIDYEFPAFDWEAMQNAF